VTATTRIAKPRRRTQNHWQARNSHGAARIARAGAALGLSPSQMIHAYWLIPGAARGWLFGGPSSSHTAYREVMAAGGGRSPAAWAAFWPHCANHSGDPV
jgi:hypothetical protein